MLCFTITWLSIDGEDIVAPEMVDPSGNFLQGRTKTQNQSSKLRKERVEGRYGGRKERERESEREQERERESLGQGNSPFPSIAVLLKIGALYLK